MEALPDPLVPAEVDLRDFPFMPLEVVRLRDSDLAAEDDAEAFKGAVLAWCAAWHQSPAASLPDDDAKLARLLGYGRDTKKWKRARRNGALRGFVLCSDGRLYHPVVAEKALESWSKKSKQRKQTAAATAAKRAAALEAANRIRLLEHKKANEINETASRNDERHDGRDAIRNDERNGDRCDSPREGEEGKERKGEEEKGDSYQPPPSPEPRASPDAGAARSVGSANDLLGGVDAVLEAAGCADLRKRFLSNFKFQAQAVEQLKAILDSGADLEADVLPAVREAAARPGFDPGQVGSIAYFRPVVARARMKAVPATQPAPEEVSEWEMLRQVRAWRECGQEHWPAKWGPAPNDPAFPEKFRPLLDLTNAEIDKRIWA